jgi:drug/metabolite transporter (DMT)-like permease
LLIGRLSLGFNFGNLAGFVLSFCVAGQLLITDSQAKKGEVLILGFLQIFICSLFSSIWYVINDTPKVEFNLEVMIALVVTGVLSTAVAFTIQVVAQSYTTPLKTALIFSCEPVFGAIFSALIPKSDGSLESLTFHQILGCLLILVAIFVSDKLLVDKIKSMIVNTKSF